MLTFSTIAASQNNDVVSIAKGAPAPFSGILFTEEKANDIRRELLEGDKTAVKLQAREEQLKLHQTMLELKSSEVELYRKQNERLERSNRSSDTMNYVWFGLGVFLTGAAVYAAGSLSR